MGVCAVCKYEGELSVGRSTYCSEKCYQRAYRLKRRGEPVDTVRTCQVCGGSILMSSSTQSRNCSDECRRTMKRWSNYARGVKARAAQAQVELGRPVQCRACDTVFMSWQPRARHCSLKCYRRIRRIEQIKASGLELKCQECEQVLEVGSGRCKYCSTRCKSRHTSRKQYQKRSQ